ncbi:hypothetical protein GCM10023321_14530 [Pseudonocardia eucalypti]|uniref:Thiolase N-terminal domain-containing protein n=1 Tax=Pseudonocardia eucalypti TaxID=648755 RepID=A0ABP9PRV3_9PSEU|nr:acetyl-CoA acetyltransferase [Pseudonocardia eucalypti]
MEEFALRSHQRALHAREDGRFDREITPFEAIEQDEGPRADTTLDKMAELKTLTPAGRLTAAVSSQISDAAALLIASKQTVRTGPPTSSTTTEAAMTTPRPRLPATAGSSARTGDHGPPREAR